MTDPLRESARRTPPADEVERANRIEELLVAGLDHYFAAEYEQAINVWTRVVFLERDHDRARAYIDRARTAIAERQRESEELLHRGVDAYESGDEARARDLLTRAVEQGAPSDKALVLLQRLERFEGAGFGAHPMPTVLPARPFATSPNLETRRRRLWVMAGLGLLAFGIAVVFGGDRALSWLTAVPSDAAIPTQAKPEPLPIVRAADRAIDRARTLYANGHPYDALRLLDSVGLADAARPEADRLRADIQRVLLAASGTGTAALDGGNAP